MYCDDWDYSYLVEGVSSGIGPIIMCDDEYCIWVGLVWDTRQAHVMAFGMIVKSGVWARPFPCHLV